MTQSAATSGRLTPPSGPPVEELQRRLKNRLLNLLHKGLPTLPSYVLDLNTLLNSPAVDLRKVSKVIRTDPSLTAQVLRLCNSALFGLRRRVLSIEQAAVLLGTERLRSMLLTCTVMQFAGKHVPVKSLLGFWQHSFLAALLSERIADLVDYPEKEQAYLGGLLHDIGQLPLWMLVMEEQLRQQQLPPANWPDNPALERDYFGLDHGKVGRWLAVSWNFMPSFLDVFENHHHPENAQHDPYLVAVVAAVDQFLQAQTIPDIDFAAEDGVSRLPLPASDAPPPADRAEMPGYLSECFASLTPQGRLQILDTLQTEFAQVLPLVHLGIAAFEPGSGVGQISVQEKST
jgi:HD-like signal output (HDOD) protein